MAAFAAEPPGFWVWHRRDALRVDERAAVQAAHATLYWHVGELALSGSTARWRWREAAPAEAGAIPVLRLDLIGLQPLRQPGLAESLAKLADAAGRLQVDCDCPDRLLSEYAVFFCELRRRVPHLSATALAGWSGKPGFAELQTAVESLAVMFYDLEPDPARIGPEAPPLPLLAPRAFAKRLASWAACKTRWQAGLPNFSRISVYNPDGRCLGHVRNWTWDEVTFQPRLKFDAAPAPGVVLLRATANLVIAETPVKAGARVAVRCVDRQALASALDLIQGSRASGVVWFRLPDSSDASGASVIQLSHLESKPDLHLRIARDNTGSQRLVLANDSSADLPARILGDGPGQRGYALELDASGQDWREALPGDFWRVGAHADPKGKPSVVSVPFATRLTFWFSHLRAGESLATGLIQLAPEASFRQIRYRIVPGDALWKTFD